MPTDPWVLKGYDEPSDPGETDMWLRYCNTESSKADAAIKRANDLVVWQSLNLTNRINEVTLSEDTPAISRTFTVAHLKAYVEWETRGERMLLALAEAELAAAKSRMHVLGRISSNCQTLNGNLRGERGEKWNTSSPNRSQDRPRYR